MSVEINRGERRGYGTAGIGYIIIPNNKDRDSYIQKCYRNHTVAIRPGLNYSNTYDIPITSDALSKIEFPERTVDLGSTIVWVREDFQNRPVVIGVIKDTGKPSLLSSSQQQIIQEYGNQLAQIFLDAKKSLLNISVVGNNANPAVVNVKATGSSEDEVNIESGGSIHHNSRNETHTITEEYSVSITNGLKEIYQLTINDKELKILDQWGNSVNINELSNELKDAYGRTLLMNKDEVHYTDGFKNEVIFNEDNAQIICNKFNVGQGAEQMVLGNTLKDLLERLITSIQNITVPTPHGISGKPINTAQFASIKSELGKILSKLSNTD